MSNNLSTDVQDAIRTELNDPAYLAVKHYSNGTYGSGCRGPLCKAAHNDIKAYARARAAFPVQNKEYADSEHNFYKFVAIMLDSEHRRYPSALIYQLTRCKVELPESNLTRADRVFQAVLGAF